MSVSANNGPRDVSPADKAAARKAAKAAWTAATPFPVAFNPGSWSLALAAASSAASILDAALALAEHGVPVFPVSPVGEKKPLNAHGVYSATTDLAVVEHEFRRDIEPLIAAPMGRRTGVFAIDIDASPPHAHDGIAAWRALEAKHSATTTRVHVTPSGGLHLLFVWPPERPIGCPIKGLPKGIECKGEGGSIIFPPSERGDAKYGVVNDVEPANAPDWLLEMVAPIRTAQPRGLRPVGRRACGNGDGSPYGLKALDNACASVANAGAGQRDRSVGENVLAIGSLVAGGELNEGHALHALKQASQSNTGAGADYYDKIEQAFATGMQNSRAAPKTGFKSKRRAGRRLSAARAPKSDADERADDASCPSSPSCLPVPDQQEKEKKSASSFDVVMKKIGDLESPSEAAARAIFAEAFKAGLSDFELETLIKPLAKKVGVGMKPVRGLLAETRLEATMESAASPEAQARRRAREAAARKAAAEEGERLKQASKGVAGSPTLLHDMEAVVHELGVVGEGGAIRGAYLTASSRLLRKRAISLLRRGAAAGGKNFLLAAVLRLIPSDSVVLMSSGSPMSLVYYGGGDEDALKHKVLYVQEAAILAEKDGVENPLTIMLRLLISEGRIDHHIAVPQGKDIPISVHIKRNGPVAVIITSARDNVESEMLTRLLTSDADESPELTMAVVKGLLAGADGEERQPDLSPWLDYQRWLEFEAPYEVTIPFGTAVYAAYEKRLVAFPKAVQLRMRRDMSGLISAIKTSAVLHKAQREADAKGRTIATVEDYRHAYEVFDEGVSSLYGVKMRKEIIAIVEAVEGMGARIGESVKVTVAALKIALGINSNSTAAERLMEAVERGALEMDEEKSGSGRGRPRYFKLLRTSAQIAAEPATGVFPPPDDVVREINSPSSVSSGQADKRDKRDETTGVGEAPSAQAKKTPGWSVRL